MFRFKWWTAASKGRIDLHFTETAITRTWDLDMAYYKLTLWCPLQSREILVGIDYVN